MELLLINSKVQEQPQRAAVPGQGSVPAALPLSLPLSLSLFLVLTNVRRPKMLTVSNYQSRNRNRKIQQAEGEEEEAKDEAEKRGEKMCRNCSARKWLKFYLPRRLKLPATMHPSPGFPYLPSSPSNPLSYCPPLTPYTHFGHCLLPSKLPVLPSSLFCLVSPCACLVVLLIVVALYIPP